VRALRSIVVVFCLLAAGTQADAQVLYGAIGADNSGSDLYVVNASTGATTSIGPIGFSLTGLATEPGTGDLYGVTAGAATGRQLVLINRTTGAGTVIGPINLGGAGTPDISFRSDGTLFGWNENGDDLITINPSTGQGTVVGDAGISTSRTGLAVNGSGTLYLAGQGASGALRTVDPVTGLTTVVVTLTGAPLSGAGMPALTFHPATDVLYAINGGGGAAAFLVTINTTTGVVSSIGSLPNDFDALAWGEAAAVPTMPTGMFVVLSIALVSLALFAIGRRPRLA
jgi:hypothetical protein